MPNDTIHAFADRLTRRKKRVAGAQRATDGVLIAGGMTLLLAGADVILGLNAITFPVASALLGVGALLGYVWGSSRPRHPYRALLDADRAHSTFEQLTTAFEIEERGSDNRFARAILERARELVPKIDPRRLYRPAVYRRYLLLPALLLATAVVAGLERSPGGRGGTIVQLGGQQAPPSDELPTTEPPNRPDGGLSLAEELRNLGESNAPEEQQEEEAPEAANRAQSVEEQVRQLERESLEDDDIEFGEEAEEAVRGALRRGMSESQIMDMITRMRSEGRSDAEIVEELSDEANELPPNANLDTEPSDDAVDDPAQRLVPVPPSEQDGQPTEEGRPDRGEPTQGGEAEVDAGVDAETGEAQGTPEAGEDPSTPPDTEGEEQSRGESPSDRGGRMPAEDANRDDFARANESRIAAEITGKVVEETFLNLVIRDLPQEAITELQDSAPEVRYERAVEAAIEREAIPADLEPLVRSYFLRIARRRPDNQQEQGEQE